MYVPDYTKGAIKEFWGFEATLFLRIELKKCARKQISRYSSVCELS